MPKTPITQTNALYQAIAQYISERPGQADNLFHWSSFAHCFADALMGVSQCDLLEVFDVLVQAGWLDDEPAGYRITRKARQEARSGGMPQR